MNSSDVYLELVKIGCCSRCCLRFLGEKFCNFEDPLQSLKDVLPITLEDEVKIKKVKQNTCCACLGLLEDSFLDELLTHSCWNRLQEYETDDYRINLNSPANISIREKAVIVHLKQKFPDFVELNLNDISLTHFVFKLAFKRRLDAHCGKKYDVHSGVQLWTVLNHDDNEEEAKVITHLDDAISGRKNRGRKIYGKNAITTILSSVDDKKFIRFLKIPPEIPSTPVHIESVKIESLPIFIGGRYCKYSRLLSQTPWNVEATGVNSSDDENQDKVEETRNISSSVMQIMLQGIHEVFGFDIEKITFTASGREDADVRCLGSGRPFFMKIECVRKTLPDELFRKLEEVINQSDDIAVFDMQQTDKISAKEVKSGEEMKKKYYMALCLIRGSKSVEEVVEKINSVACNLQIVQRTPVRVSHRRSICIRYKTIYFMKAAFIPGHDRLFQLTLLTQAGTYIKEFIHGDFGRTRPNVSELTSVDIDIFRLDVIGIDLDWPKHINSVPHPAVTLIKEKRNETGDDVKPDPENLKFWL